MDHLPVRRRGEAAALSPLWRRPRGRLRIAVPAHVIALHPRIGHGRVWHGVLGELRALADVVPVAAGERARRADAWLIDGHTGGVQTDLPVVAQVHEVSWFVPESQSMDPRFMEQVIRQTLEGIAAADRIITGSESTRQQIPMVSDVGVERIDVVPHGVDAELFHPVRPGEAAPVEPPYVLFVGTVHPRKNLPSLRAAMAALAARGVPQRLVLVAAPAMDRDDSAELEREAFSELPGAPGRVVRVATPSDEELSRLMAFADAFVLPSLWEGFGLTSLEALACGVPVIVSANGAMPEVVGDAGVVVEPTPEGIEAGLARVLGDVEFAASLRVAGRARAEGLTWERAARGWLASVQRAVEER